MKKTLFQKVLCLLLSVTTLLGVFGLTVMAAPSDGSYGTNRDTASSLEEMTALIGVPTYSEYLNKYKDNEAAEGAGAIKIDVVGDRIEKESNSMTVADSLACQDSIKRFPELWENFYDGSVESEALFLPENGSTTWSFNVPDGAASYYYIKITYFNCYVDYTDPSDSSASSKSSISSIERKLFIDGAAPFKETSYVTFNKTWQFDFVSETEPVDCNEEDSETVTYVTKKLAPEDEREAYCKVVRTVKNKKMVEKTYAISQDINGNSMLPTVEQTSKWGTYYCQDSTGYNLDFFRFYIFNGTHTLTLEAEREPVIISSIELIPVDSQDPAVKAEVSLPTYAEVLSKYETEGAKPAKDKDGKDISVRLEAEFPDFVSDSAVYPTNDKTSSATYPSEPDSQVYNVIGENSYNALGQWAAYKFTVSETGLYKFGMRYLQNALQGMYICRSIKLSGGQNELPEGALGRYGLTDGSPTAPFLEAYSAEFDYSDDWQSTYVNYRNESGEKVDFQFYFVEGVEYTVYLECSLGSLREIINAAETSLNNLNEYYLRILQLTGSTPDDSRDYQFHKVMPDVLDGLKYERDNLTNIKKELEALCEDSGAHTATLQTVAILLDTMWKDRGVEIAKNLGNFKSYLGTLGTWINDSKKGTLIVDNINIVPADQDGEALPEAKAGFFSSLWFEVRSFFYSFFIDYEAMGLTAVPDEDSRTVDVWLAEGRDQSNIWRTMIDAEGGFTDTTGYGVTLKLVTAPTLLPSILAGKGPDVYMGLDSGSVINYAIRKAVLCVNGNDEVNQSEDQRAIFTHYIYRNDENEYFYLEHELTADEVAANGYTLVSKPYSEVSADNYVTAATNTLTLEGNAYGVPQTMNFAMMFYRMDVLAELGEEVPQTWDELLSVLPTLQSNNMQIGVNYILALDFMIYQKGGSMWKYESSEKWAGARIALDTPVALESFNFICRLFSDYAFPVSFDASNRFRTGEMPIVVGDYISTYNTLTVYATEIDGLWEFCPLPGSDTGKKDQDGDPIINYNSLASVTASIILEGARRESVETTIEVENEQGEIETKTVKRYPDMEAAWAYLQWQTSASVQANYGNKMVALIGPSAKYQAANKNAIKDLSWTAKERAAIEDQMANLSSIVNYPGSYIMARYMKFAFLEAVDEGTAPTEAITQYIETINLELTRKREEFDMATLAPTDPDPVQD
ncbi:MAG: extracellular solute-binding protein [Clostridia bacterium]|nr:extracellular solute-binding protein [Clostridia bacterium]